MKKIISLMLAAFMMINICAFAAAEELTGNFTFVDSAYSPELDMYVAMAKDLTSANHDTQLYRSNDGLTWTPCFTSVKPGKNYSVDRAGQVLVWWEAEGVFVAYMGNTAYYSKNGVKWELAPMVSQSTVDGKDKSNIVLETDGEKLFMCQERRIGIMERIDEPKTEILAGSGQYYTVIGKVPEKEDYFILSGSDWGGYTSSLSNGVVSVQEKFNNNQFTIAFDMAYVPQAGKWLTVNKEKKDSTNPKMGVVTQDIITSAGAISYITPKLESGNNTETITGVGVGEDYVVFGTKSGKLYYTDAAGATESSSVWKEITGKTVSDEIRTISKSRDGYMIALSAKEAFVLQETADGVIFADTTVTKISSGEERIEAPQTGTEDIEVDSCEINYFGQETKGLIDSVEAGEGNDDVAAEWNGSKIVYTVPETADGVRKFNVTDIYGNTQEFEVNFVKETGVDLDGFTSITIPDEGQPNVNVKYTPYVVASDGGKMDRKANLSLIDAPNGVSLNEKTNIITVTDEAELGTFILRVTSDGNPENTKDFEIQIAPRLPASIEVTSDKESLVISDDSNITFNCSAVVKDQVDLEMPNEKVIWSVGGSSEGITVDSNGVVTVTPEARSGELKVIATSETVDTVFGEASVTLTWTDERCVIEDLAAFDENIVTGENLPFVSVSKDGTKMTWTTSDEGVITEEGVITRNRQKDTYATVKLFCEKGKYSGSKTINVTVLKEDNIASIGDFEDQNAEGLNGEITTENVHGGEYALKTNGALSFDIDVNNDSSYIFEAYVKAPGNIKLSTKVAGEIVTVKGGNDYVKVIGSYDYRRQSSSFKDTVTISASGDYYVDDIKIYEITLEYEELMEAITKAESSEKQADIDAAKELLEDYPDVPLKETLKKRIDNIGKEDSGGNGGTGGTGGSGGGGGTFNPPSQNTGGTVGIGGSTVDNDDKVEEYLLKFKDMKDHWAKDDVEYMAGLGIVSGVTENTFNPDANITRAEFAKLIVSTMGLSAAEYENSYYDVISEDWYASYVQTAKNEGYITGYNGLFRPNDYITREEMAKVIVEAYNKKSNITLEQGGALYFSDIQDISAWAYDYIVEATNEGFMSGVSEIKFAPKQNATRAQAVVILRRLYDKVNGVDEEGN